MKRVFSFASIVAACVLTTPALALAASPTPHRPTPPTPPRVTQPLTARQSADARRTASLFLARKHVSTRLAANGSGLVARPAQQSLGVTVQRYDQTYHGLPVLGSQVVVRLANGQVRGATNATHPSLRINTSPAFAPTTARAFAIARHSVAGASSLRLVDRGLAVLPQGRGMLVRHVTALGVSKTGMPLQQEVFVANGLTRPALSYSTIVPFNAMTPPDGPVDTTAAGYNGPNLPLQVYLSNGVYQLKDISRPATLTTYLTHADAANFPLDLSGSQLVTTPSLPFSTQTSRSGAIDAQWGAGEVLDYYASQFGRNSLDGNGMAVRSYVGLRFLGKPMPNAAWTGKEMVYGAGSRHYKPFSASLDVVGHEMTHGVIQHTSNLLYFGQSGATNEAFADYFGNAIGDDTLHITPADPTYSLVGEDLCRTTPPAQCAKFDLSQPMTTAQYYQGLGDQQGVHINSPIISSALWHLRLVLGGTVADKLAYAAMTQYLTPSSGFLAVRYAMINAARAQALSPADVATVRASFTANGIVRGWDAFHLEPGTHIARSGLANPYSTLDLRNGVLVSTDIRDGREVVLAGSITARRAHLLPGLSSGIILDAATNGREVIAVGWSFQHQHVTSTVRVSSVDGLRTQTLARLSSFGGDIVKVAIGNGEYAWQTRTYSRQGPQDTLVIRTRNGQTERIHPGGPTIGAWSLMGRQVVFTDGRSSRLRSFNTDTGVVHTLWTPKAQAGFQPRIRNAVLTAHHIAVAANLHAGPATSVVTFDRAGGHRHLVWGEQGPGAAAMYALDASDKAITVGLRSGRLIQIDTATNHRAPVSCGLVKHPWAQGEGTRVAWVEHQFGKTVIVTRPAPMTGCTPQT